MLRQRIRPAAGDDAARICEIYNHYVTSTIVTFEEVPVPVDEMSKRIEAVTAAFPWLVHETGGIVDGYAYAASWKRRSAYRFAVESTIYLHPGATGRGIGERLYRALIEALCRCPVHSVIGGISLPNPASVALHEKLGFSKIGQFREVGWKLERWVDVGYWELVLDGPLRS
jgi:L-amino acid N-acyltransferase YncA